MIWPHLQNTHLLSFLENNASNEIFLKNRRKQKHRERARIIINAVTSLGSGKD
jgi:hypothetical protein